MPAPLQRKTARDEPLPYPNKKGRPERVLSTSSGLKSEGKRKGPRKTSALSSLANPEPIHSLRQAQDRQDEEEQKKGPKAVALGPMLFDSLRNPLKDDPWEKESSDLWLAFCTRQNQPRVLVRKEVIQPQVLLRLPCYDFTPIRDHTVGACPPCGLAKRRLVQPPFVM